jgi:S-adenosylmethionine synthetase
VDRIEAVEEAHCMLVSRIGQPVHEPALVALELRTPDGALTESVRAQAEEVTRAELARLKGPLWKDWLAATD